MAADGHSQYVKLTKEQAPVEDDINPGELNQPIDVPQLNVRRCIECGQVLPEDFEAPEDERWMTGIFGCAEDSESCWTGLFCPCILFGRNYEKLKDEDDTPWTKPCMCHAIFVEGGIALAIVMTLFPGLVVDPDTMSLICEGLLFAWWMCGIQTGLTRQALQKKYHLENTPCDPCTVHCCMHWCALCQEHREMQGRLSDNFVMSTTFVDPPPIQEMSSASRTEGGSSSSIVDSNNQLPLSSSATNLEMQAYRE
ncbi:Cell number regulator 6 [Linum perenne]